MNFKEIIKEKVFKPYSLNYEIQRIKFIKSNFIFNSDDKILDFGGSDGGRMSNLFPGKTEGIFISDISRKVLA